MWPEQLNWFITWDFYCEFFSNVNYGIAENEKVNLKTILVPYWSSIYLKWTYFGVFVGGEICLFFFLVPIWGDN